MKRRRTLGTRVVFVTGLSVLSTAALAGPVIIDGTDANDHGFATASANTTGWLYMQRALENLAGAVTSSAAKVVVDLGTTTSTARSAIDSAFTFSSLSGAGGWTLMHVDGAANIATWLGSLSTSNTGILYIPTFAESSGDLDSTEMAAINAGAAQINSYVSGAGNPAQGGALFAMGEDTPGGWGWLTTLLPGLGVIDHGTGGVSQSSAPLTLTAAGQSAFPGLSNNDLRAGPWHNSFSGNLGGLQVLATATNVNTGLTENVIIGGGAGTSIQCGLPGTPPCPTPEPGAPWLLGLALAALAAIRRWFTGRSAIAVGV